MLSLVPRRLLRASVCLAVPQISSLCSPASTASRGLYSPLSSGRSVRSFSSSSVCLVGAFRLCDVRLKGGFNKSFSRTARNAELRLHGTVTAFKHRRGYGFVLAEGVVPGTGKAVYASLSSLQANAAAAAAAAGDGAGGDQTEDAAAHASEHLLHKSYFFVRSGLGGGFYVMEGERVSFRVEDVKPELGTQRYLGAPAFASAAGSSSADTANAAEEFSLDAADGEHAATHGGDAAATTTTPQQRAASIRFYDTRSNTETAVAPVTLYGKVVAWDDATGTGEIAELDVQRHFHSDAPRFSVSLEDMDLGGGSRMFVNRYVRFCLGPASTSKGSGAGGDGEVAEVAADPGDAPLVAQRVIIDFSLERRYGAFGRPLVPASAAPGSVTDQTRFTGVVREVRAGRFGFIVDDLSGESIFFHATSARAGVGEGCRVSYLLREMTGGKHAGKKACYDVKRVTGEPAGHRTSDTLGGAVAEDDDVLLEGEETVVGRVKQSGAASKPAPRQQRRPAATSPDSEEIDFDTLH